MSNPGERYYDLNEYNWLMAEIDRHETEQAMALGELLINTLAPKSVIDYGCGSGIYLVPFKNKGIKVLGIDGADGSGQHIKPDWQQVDFRKPFAALDVFDLALCIEVAEHVPPQYADMLIDGLCASANTIFFSAARPGQGGEGHYNEKDKQYWIEKFNTRGFVTHPKQAEIQAAINIGIEYEHCHWLRWNSMVFKRQ